MTNVAEIEQLVDAYRNWQKDRTTVQSVHRDWVEITTPFLDRHNDNLQIYAKSSNGGYVLSDDGQTIRDLEMSGCTIDTPKRKAILQTTLNGFGVGIENGVITTFAKTNTFPFRKHAILQAMLAVNDLFYLSSATVRNLFREDVQHWLEMNDVRFVPNIQFAGKSGYQHYFDFAIPKSKTEPERLLRAITNPNKDSALNFINAWTDTSDQREENVLPIAILNDIEKSVPTSVAEALEHYSIKQIPWSRRHESLQLLAA